jgi:hypothetical protein
MEPVVGAGFPIVHLHAASHCVQGLPLQRHKLGNVAARDTTCLLTGVESRHSPRCTLLETAACGAPTPGSQAPGTQRRQPRAACNGCLDELSGRRSNSSKQYMRKNRRATLHRRRDWLAHTEPTGGPAPYRRSVGPTRRPKRVGWYAGAFRGRASLNRRTPERSSAWSRRGNRVGSTAGRDFASQNLRSSPGSSRSALYLGP